MHHVNKRDFGTRPPGSSVFPIYSEFFNVKRLFGQAVSTHVYEITSQMSVDEEDEERLFEDKII